jgi:hypothetical protein
MYEEVVVAYLKVLSDHYHEVTGKSTKTVIMYRIYIERHLNRVYSAYKFRASQLQKILQLPSKWVIPCLAPLFRLLGGIYRTVA